MPIFDPQYDTFGSIRSRSSILLNAICTIGCMVETSNIIHSIQMAHFVADQHILRIWGPNVRPSPRGTQKMD